MTPVVLLVVFCAVMAAVAVGRLAIEDERDPVEIGTALVVAGITSLTAVWAAIEVTLLSAAGLALLALVGAALVGGGVTVMLRYWEESATTRASGD